MNPPSIAEELNRKGIEAVLWLVDSVRNGDISEDQYAAGINSIWATVAGLCKGDFFEVISQASPTDYRTIIRRVFTDGKVTYVLRWQCGSESFELIRLPGQTSKTIEHRPTKSYIEAFVGSLNRMGFTEV